MSHRIFGVIIGLVAAIGAINWGLIGAFNFDLVVYLFGSMPSVVKAVYILVGICGLLLLFSCRCMHKNCCKSSCSSMNDSNNPQV